jgi:hypothetical protein
VPTLHPFNVLMITPMTSKQHRAHCIHSRTACCRLLISRSSGRIGVLRSGYNRFGDLSVSGELLGEIILLNNSEAKAHTSSSCCPAMMSALAPFLWCPNLLVFNNSDSSSSRLGVGGPRFGFFVQYPCTLFLIVPDPLGRLAACCMNQQQSAHWH